MNLLARLDHDHEFFERCVAILFIGIAVGAFV